jgi:hypothetical protein
MCREDYVMETNTTLNALAYIYTSYDYLLTKLGGTEGLDVGILVGSVGSVTRGEADAS